MGEDTLHNSFLCVECEGEKTTEDYSQLDPHVLAYSPSHVFPINLYHFKEDIQCLTPIYYAGNKIDAAQRTLFKQLSKEGSLFFSRAQIETYVELVGSDSEVALEDPNLTWPEKAKIFIDVMGKKQDAFFAQPLSRELEALEKVLGSFCVYAVEDADRMGIVVKRLHTNLSQEHRRINASLMALAVYLELNKNAAFLERLESVALGFFLYDLGMTKISNIMLGQNRALNPGELRTLHEHPKKGLAMLSRFQLTRPEVTEPALQHHERLDGSGYPNSLKGNSIGMLGRIAGVADSYIAMVTGNAHRQGIAPIEAAGELFGKKDKYDGRVLQTLIQYLQTVPAS